MQCSGGGDLTAKSEVPGLIPNQATYFMEINHDVFLQEGQ